MVFGSTSQDSLNARRITESRESYWQSLFNDYAAQYEKDHCISGWSLQGLEARNKLYLDIFSTLSIDKTAPILDLGCGSGVYSRLLHAGGYNAVGMDYAFNALIQAKKRDGLGDAAYLGGDLYFLPFKDCSFKHVLCIGVFQSLTRPHSALAEIRRIMAPGASLVLITLNSLQIRHLFSRVMSQSDYILVDQHKVARLAAYNPFQFKRELEAGGFRVIDQKPVQVLPDSSPSMSKLLAALQRMPCVAYLTAVSFMVTAIKQD